jgi:hypothetical protein
VDDWRKTLRNPNRLNVKRLARAVVPYYKALQQGEGRSEALRQVQLRILRERRESRHPFYWAAFIQSGEWTNLDGQR